MTDGLFQDAGIVASEWLAQELHEAGVTHVFFVDAILRRTLIKARQLGIAPVLAHSEKAAAYMADGYARAARRPGVCMAQSVGAANLAAGLQDAFLARSPVIAVTGRKPSSHQNRNAYQEVVHAPLFAPLTKFSATVERGGDFPRLLRYAWRHMMTGRPGPVHLDLEGLQGEITEQAKLTAQTSGHLPRSTGYGQSTQPDPGELKRAANLLRKSDRPVIIAGDDAAWVQAGPSILALSRRLGAPIATTVGARGILPTDRLPSVGTVGTYGIPPTNQIINAADVAILVGCDTSDQATCDWTVPSPATQLIEVSRDPLELGRSYANSVGLLGDLCTTIDLLADDQDVGRNASAFLNFAAAALDGWRKSISPARQPSGVVSTEQLCQEISACLPDNAILVSDTGNSAIWTATTVELNGSTQDYLRSAGSLGWSFPAALGAKCAAPDRPVVCFCGDGAFYYHLAELETARRRGIAVTVIVNNNSGFGQAWPEISVLSDSEQTAATLTQFGPVNFADMAKALGVRGIRVERPDEVKTALHRAMSLNETVVVDVATAFITQPPQASRP